MKFFTDFLGCKVNAYECDAIARSLIEKGYIRVFSEEENPDIIIFNTCSVTSTSDKKSRQLARHYRKNNKEAILCLMGCYIQGTDEDSIKKIDCDIIIGNDKKSSIPSYIEEFIKNKNKIISINKDFTSFCYDSSLKTNFSEITRAYCKIQDGCSNFCSYCLIPYVRGVKRSRNSDDVIDEINVLIKNGYKEIVLTGIDVASYHCDTYDLNFSGLIKKILKECKDLFRLRISSIEESNVDSTFIDLLRENKIIARHLHLSLQSGSDFILKGMNRKYLSDEYLKKVELLNKIEDISLTTDIIVGFPGEGEKEFLETIDFIKKCNFMKLHVFPYSIRQGTAASKFKNQVNDKIKKERVKILLNLSKQLEENYIASKIGKEYEFLIESYDKEKDKFIGRSSNYLEKYFDNKDIKINDIIKSKL